MANYYYFLYFKSSTIEFINRQRVRFSVLPVARSPLLIGLEISPTTNPPPSPRRSSVSDGAAWMDVRDIACR